MFIPLNYWFIQSFKGSSKNDDSQKVGIFRPSPFVANFSIISHKLSFIETPSPPFKVWHYLWMIRENFCLWAKNAGNLLLNLWTNTKSITFPRPDCWEITKTSKFGSPRNHPASPEPKFFFSYEKFTNFSTNSGIIKLDKETYPKLDWSTLSTDSSIEFSIIKNGAESW